MKYTEIELYRMLLQTDYCAYVKHVHEGRWEASRFHKFLCNEVQSFIETETGNPYDILIIHTPPQHGKSQTITETLPSWYLGKNPLHRVIEISYSEDFAMLFGRRNKDKIREKCGDIFGMELAKSPNSSTEFELKNNVGGMISRGVLSGVTGRPCNLMIIDDPIKNSQEAFSESYRNSVWNEWTRSFKTRLAPGAKVILIMTRWHEDDLAGRLLAKEENVRYLRIPCEAEENDPIGRKAGDALCPEIGKDNAWLVPFKKSYIGTDGSSAWEAMFQGRPTSEEGNMLKREWWSYYDELPPIVDWVMSVDAAFKDGKDNDFVAIQVWGKTGADMYLIDAVKKHLNMPDTMREIKRLRAMYPKCVTTLIEDKANGSAIVQMLRREMFGIIPIEPQGGKVARVNAVSGAIESGNVHLPHNKPFTDNFVDECAAFPRGAHDDQVDCMSQALNRMIYSRAENKPMKPVNALEKAFPGLKKKKPRLGIGDKINVI